MIVLWLFFVPDFGESYSYVTPVGEHVCDGYIEQKSGTEIVSEKVPVIEEYHENCLSISEFFRCTKTRTYLETKHTKVPKENILVKGKKCCPGYKQIDTKCIKDDTQRNNLILKWVIFATVVVALILLCVGFIVPTCFYLREKRRRLHLEDLEHDPETFVRPSTCQNSNRHGNNIYTLASPNDDQATESHYETIDDIRGLPPAYETCSINESSTSVTYTRQQPPPYSEGLMFNEHGYDQLKFGNMSGPDLSYGAKNVALENKKETENYSKLQQSYKSFQNNDKNQPGSSKFQ